MVLICRLAFKPTCTSRVLAEVHLRLKAQDTSKVSLWLYLRKRGVYNCLFCLVKVCLVSCLLYNLSFLLKILQPKIVTVKTNVAFLRYFCASNWISRIHSYTVFCVNWALPFGSTYATVISSRKMQQCKSMMLSAASREAPKLWSPELSSFCSEWSHALRHAHIRE